MVDVQAQEAKLLLESHGIGSILDNEKLANADIATAYSAGGIKLLVNKEDAGKARKILEET